MTCLLQWMPLNGITDNGINQLMESEVSRFTSPKLLCHTSKLICLLVSFGSWDQLWSDPKQSH